MGGRGSSSKLGGEKSTGYVYEGGMSFKEFQKANMEELKKLHKESGMQAVKDAYYETVFRAEVASAHAMSKADAVDAVRDAIPQNVSDGWFRAADSGYKPKIVQCITENKGVINAGWNIAYQNYVETLPAGAKPQSFDKWLRTPQTLYRGTHGQKTVASDVFSAYTPNINIAKSFGDNISTIKVRPIDTWGSYQTTGEQEYLVPAKRLRK